MSKGSNFRFRRLRQTATLRQLGREARLTSDDLVLPVFVEESIEAPVLIESMPGVYRYPESGLADVISKAWAKGIKSFI